MKTCSVLLRPPVAGLQVAELPIDYAEGVCALGADAGLGKFGLLRHITPGRLCQSLALAVIHGHMPVDSGVPVFFPFFAPW